MALYAIGERTPTIHATAFVHPDAVIIGNVTVGAEASIWPTAVLRGDTGRVVIGAQTSVQDGSVLHCTDTWDTLIGARCVIGHRAHLEGCTVEDDSLVGSGSVVLHRVVVRTGGMVAAQALVSPGTEVPSGAVAMGVPARIKADSVPEGLIASSVNTYVRNAHWYNAHLRRIG
jgi:carbonic anhydrase/acetyltransferase-like protein (isoleucine patch superfamily)